jgi:hypothetical protein
LVANRALDPMSKLAALEWAQQDTWLPGVGELGGDPQIFYRVRTMACTGPGAMA